MEPDNTFTSIMKPIHEEMQTTGRNNFFEMSWRNELLDFIEM